VFLLGLVLAVPAGAQLIFTDVAVTAGLTARGLGMGVMAFDADNDLDLDLYWTTWPDSPENINRLYLNRGDGTFEDASLASGTDDPLGGGDFDGRGLAFADFDNDGDLDLVVTADAGQPTRLWRNDTPIDNHWVVLRLQGTTSNR
jgi:hypothetical protein